MILPILIFGIAGAGIVFLFDACRGRGNRGGGERRHGKKVFATRRHPVLPTFYFAGVSQAAFGLASAGHAKNGTVFRLPILAGGTRIGYLRECSGLGYARTSIPEIAMIDFSDLPDDPELAFVTLVSKFDEAREAKIASSDERSDTSIFLLDYMNNVVGVANALHLDLYDDWEMPESDRAVYELYREFSLRTKRYVLEVQLRHARIGKHYSVGLNAGTKARIRKLVEQIKEQLEKSDLEERKRNVLFGKLNKFLEEVDRERTRYDAAMDMTLEIVGAIDKASSPIIALLDSVTRLLAQAKSAEPLELPPPKDRRKIEGPRKQLPKPKTMDDDIPF
jgi:hypothetical protein